MVGRPLSERLDRVGASPLRARVATFLSARLTAWPPHEDETLALFVGRGTARPAARHRARGARRCAAALPLRRGGGALGGGLTALRLGSALFALASLPLIALLVRGWPAERSR